MNNLKIAVKATPTEENELSSDTIYVQWEFFRIITWVLDLDNAEKFKDWVNEKYKNDPNHVSLEIIDINS